MIPGLTILALSLCVYICLCLEQKTRRRSTLTTVGAAFIGVACGAIFALFVRDGVPAIRRKVAARQGRNYSPADDEHGIEAPERAGDAI